MFSDTDDKSEDSFLGDMESSTQSNSTQQNAPSTQTQPQPPPQTDQAESGPSTTLTGVKRNLTSIVWEHCKKSKKMVDGVMTDIATCNYCKLEMKANSKAYGTTAIKTHLTKRCEKSQMYLKTSSGQRVLTQDTMGGNLQPHVFNQAKCDLKCVEFIIKDELPFRAVEGLGFREFIRELQPKFKLPNRKKIAMGVWDLFVVEKAKIMSVIGDQRVSVTTDTWTSIQNINYMVVTAHFMDNDWVLHKRIINFIKITSHKGEDIGKTLEVCLNNWGIEKIFTITVDNVSANDVAVDFMKRRLKARNTLMLEGEYLHLRCACHILNLIVKDGLKDLGESIEGIRNCVKYLHSSPARLDKFRDFAILEKKDKMSTVPMDVATRWNSTYAMLDSALKFKGVFNRMAEDDEPFVAYFKEMEKVKKVKKVRGVLTQDKWVKRVGPPNETDWEKAQSFVIFLKKFYDTTLKLSATKTTTFEIVFKEMSTIQLEIEKKKKDSTDPILQVVASSMLLKLEKYWGSYDKINKLVFVANVLDPRYKLQRIRASFKALGKTPSEVEMICDGIKVCLHALYNYYSGEFGSKSSQIQNLYDIQEEDDCGDDLDRQLMRQRREEEAVEISNEVDKYLLDPFESLKNQRFNLLDWWKSSQSKYPILSKVAKDILAIASSTVASENAFSLGKRIVDPFRSSLTPKTVEALVCTSDWLRAEEFNFYKDPTEEEVEFYKELEEMEANSVITQSSSTQGTPSIV